jgi:hypothetical protein
MGSAGHVAHKEEMRNACKILLENLNDRDHSEDLGLNGMIISGCILEKQGGKFWTEFICFRIGTSGSLFSTQ